MNNVTGRRIVYSRRGETGEIGIFGRDRRYSRDVREKEWGERNNVTRRRIIYSRREDTGEIWQG